MTKRYGFHFTSLVAVIVFMVVGYSPMLAVFYSTFMCFILSGLAPETALGAAQSADGASRRHGRGLAAARDPGCELVADRAIVHELFRAVPPGPRRPRSAIYGMTPRQRSVPSSKRLSALARRRFDRRAQCGDHLRVRRHHRRRRHAHRAWAEILLDRSRLRGRQPPPHRDLHRLRGLDRRPRGAGDGAPTSSAR